MLRREQPEVIHVHDHHGLATALSVRGPTTRVVYDAHEYAPGKDLKPQRRVATREYLLEHARRSDAVITVGSAIADLLVIEFELPEQPAVVHNTPSLRNAKPAPYDLRAKAGLDTRTPLLVYQGGLTARRRIVTAIEALAGLPSVHLALILLADGPGADALAEAAERFGVRKRVHFLPPAPHDGVVSLIRSADIGINPLGRYGNGDVAMPNKLFEYLHAGLPMVVSDSPQMARFVREHGLGEVVPVDDPEAWARAISRILADPDAYRGDPDERAGLCREWSWETQEKVLFDVYDRLLTSQGLPLVLKRRQQPTFEEK